MAKGKYYYFKLFKTDRHVAFVRYTGSSYKEALSKICNDMKNAKGFWCVILTDIETKPYFVKRSDVVKFESQNSQQLKNSINYYLGNNATYNEVEELYIRLNVAE